MKEPTFADFIVRTGGLMIIYIIAIKLIGNLYPGYESVSVFFITTVIFVLGIIGLLKRKKTGGKLNARKSRRVRKSRRGRP